MISEEDVLAAVRTLTASGQHVCADGVGPLIGATRARSFQELGKLVSAGKLRVEPGTPDCDHGMMFVFVDD
jgi:hypothetical protein